MMDYPTLKKLFQDRDKSVRLFCLKCALRDNVDNLQEFVIEGLHDGRPEIVLASLKASKQCPDREVTDSILEYLESPNPLLRGKALNALVNRKGASVKKAVCDFLQTEEDSDLVASGIKVIGSFKSEEFMPLLRAFINYADERVRANAVEALGQIHHPEVIEALKVLASDRNSRVRVNAIKALWKRGIRFGLNTLPAELRSPNSRNRASVAYILGELEEERSLDLLIGLLNDISPTVRNRAVLSIGKIGSSKAMTHLIDAYTKEDEPSIRDAIVSTALSINPDLAMARFTEKFVREQNNRMRANLVKSLVRAVNPNSILLLSKALKDEDSRVRANAIEALGQLGDPQCADLLFPLLNDPHNRVRSNAATALWKLGGLGAILTLKQMLCSSHKHMRASAAWALGEIGALQFSDSLQYLTSDPDPDVRRSALKALAKLSKIT